MNNSGTMMDRYPGFLIRRLQQVSTSFFSNALHEWRITPLQHTILRLAEDEDGLDQTELARRAFLDLSTAANVVRRLEARGLISRKPGNRNARTRCVGLTDQGRQLLGETSARVRRAQIALLSALPEPRREEFLEMIRIILAAHGKATGQVSADAPWRRLDPKHASLTEAVAKPSTPTRKSRRRHSTRVNLRQSGEMADR